MKTPPCRGCGHPHESDSSKCLYVCGCETFSPIPTGTVGFAFHRVKKSLIPRMLVIPPEPPRAA